ncbi:hypothetical protein [Pseudomonas sp. RIT-PI-S]|uniref:hypothetical protein n=1 Tax=Pseudomonas sp. RIT-PI-S TaxID=3035295 RepID=UPI0021D8A6AF|nr:hypothetical protein [Pseudomonas sp. RIT-PI-S]
MHEDHPGLERMDLTALPGGDQDIVTALPPALARRLATTRRVILVANNPAICRGDFEALRIGQDDVVVSFNACIKADLLQSDSTNVFVHGFNAPDRYFFGLPYRGEINDLLVRAGPRCFTILVGCAAPMSPVPGVMLLRDRIPLPALWNYPIDRPGGKRYVGPSTGFNTMVLFDALRQRQGYGYQIIALGFSNEAGKLWSGHAWSYERKWLLHSDVLTVSLGATRGRGFFSWLGKFIGYIRN